LLKRRGCVVYGTPRSGDKGADIIATYKAHSFVIQTKRSSTAVGLAAVQEVAAALRWYGGTEAWVVTNASFTTAARDLAATNGVRFIDGATLARMATSGEAGA
jgi:restriction system protein